MTIGTRLFTWLRGEPVGTDAFGNRYFRDKRRRAGRRERRWVLYAGEPEGSAVPPEWHGWLHHTTDEVPVEGDRKRRPWQKPYEPNMTGTEAAYRPPGAVLAGGRRPHGTDDYEPWRPG